MRKYLGVLAGVAALCVVSWAQAPAQTPAPPPPQPRLRRRPQLRARANSIPTTTGSTAAPAPQFARIEFFGGGSYAEAGLFNAGHWAGLPGWDASLGLNATSWIGVRSGRRPILRNLKDTVRYSCAISNCGSGRTASARHSSHVRCVDARVQLSFWRAIRPPQICTAGRRLANSCTDIKAHAAWRPAVALR